MGTTYFQFFNFCLGSLLCFSNGAAEITLKYDKMKDLSRASSLLVHIFLTQDTPEGSTM